METTKITVDDAKGRMDRGEAIVFVDIRNPKAWSQSDIKLPGAIRVPMEELDKHLEEIPQEGAVITYCTGPGEASSARAAEELMNRGFKSVHPLYGGFDAWQKAGYPVEPKEPNR